MKKSLALSPHSKELLRRYLQGIKSLPWVVAYHAFLFIIIFIVLAILAGGFLFYNYVVRASADDPGVVALPTKFQENAYNEVVKEWQIRQDVFNSALQENYQNPFN